MAKGSEFERLFSRRLSLWWTDGSRDDVFWRTSNSGGRATARSHRGRTTFGQAGDIGATDPVGLPLLDIVTIELKRGYAKETIHDLFDRTEHFKQQTFETWVEQVQGSQMLSGSFAWLLITRRDRREDLVWMPRDLVDELKKVGCRIHKRIPFITFKAEVNGEVLRISGTTIEQWLDVVEPGHIKKLTRRI